MKNYDLKINKYIYIFTLGKNKFETNNIYQIN
jgi:hypothetical protein